MDLVHDGRLEGGVCLSFSNHSSCLRGAIPSYIDSNKNRVFIIEHFNVIPKVKEGSLLSDEILADVQPGDTMVFSRGEAIALWVGVILFVAILSCVLYRLCRVTVQ